MKLYDINNLRDDSYEVTAKDLHEQSECLTSILDTIQTKIEDGEKTVAEFVNSDDFLGIAEDSLQMLLNAMDAGYILYNDRKHMEDVLNLYDELCEQVDCTDKILAVIAGMHFMEILTNYDDPMMSFCITIAERDVKSVAPEDIVQRLLNIEDLFDELEGMMANEASRAIGFLLSAINVSLIDPNEED